jgi:OHCU decarboxylase
VRPSEAGKTDFMAAFGQVFEHSPWIAGRAWDNGLDRGHDSLRGLHRAFSEVIREAAREEQMSLLQAHPELAAAQAQGEDLTAHSRDEQRGAGLDRCRPDEFAEFQRLNAAYRSKFGFPFIVAVKGLDRRQILEQFRSRVRNTPETEFKEAVEQVIRIGYFRIQQLLPEEAGGP